MKTNLYFVRHGHSIYTPDEWERPLSERGLKDATSVTEILKKEKIDIVISSPYRRAIQTVEGIANHIKKKIIIVNELRERTLSEKPVEDFQSAILKVWEDFDFTWAGGESSNSARNRGAAITNKIINCYKGKNVVIGSHGNMMVLTMNFFNPQYDYLFWKELDMPDIYKLTFDGYDLIEINRIWTRV